MIEVIRYQNESIDKLFEKDIEQYYSEVRRVLPDLPELIYIYFSDKGIVPELGVGGYAYSKDIITISIDPEFADKQAQSQCLRSTIFHEAMHIYQDYTGTGRQYTAIEGVIHEGVATVFEREYANTTQPYGVYSQASEGGLREWVRQFSEFGDEFQENKSIYNAWMFYHPEFNERWIGYRTGTWLVDQVLSREEFTILDLSTKTAAEVLDMYRCYESL